MINIAKDMVSLDSAVRPNDSESSSVGEFIEDTDMIAAQTFNDLPKLGSGYSKVTLFKK